MKLRKYLSKYNEYTCPDYYYLAWKILFEGDNPPDKKEILKQAEKDMKEEERLKPQFIFNRDRRKMGGLGKRKYNWY